MRQMVHGWFKCGNHLTLLACFIFYKRWARIVKYPDNTRVADLTWERMEVSFSYSFLTWDMFRPRWPWTTGWWWKDTHNFEEKGRQFDSWLWNLLSTWHKTCQVLNHLMCFGASMSASCLKENKIKRSMGYIYVFVNVYVIMPYG